MNVTFEKTGELEGNIIVSLEKDDYAKKVTQSLKEIGAKKDIPGFRKGHIDIVQLRKRFGKAVKQEVINDLAADNAIAYIKDNKLDILGQPIPAEGATIDINDDNFTFTYQVGLAPEINIDFANATLDYHVITVDDEMVNNQDNELRQRAGEQVTSEEFGERAIVKGVIMQLNEDGTIKEDGIQVNDGMLAPFMFKNADEAKKFEGSKKDDTIVFDAYATCDGNEAELTSMLHIDHDQVEQARGNFQITITEFLIHKAAELGQEFYDKVFGADAVHNEEEYRVRVVDMIKAALQPNSNAMFARTAQEWLMSNYGENLQLPLNFLRNFLLRTHEELNEENVDATLTSYIPGIKWELLENRAAEILKVELTEEDVKAYATAYAKEALASYGMASMADEMAGYYAENLLKDENQRRQLAHQAFNTKLYTAIQQAVKLNEKAMSFAEFKAMADALNKTADENIEEAAE